MGSKLWIIWGRKPAVDVYRLLMKRDEIHNSDHIAFFMIYLALS